MTRVRILLADDHKEIRDTVVGVLQRDFEIIDAVADGQAFLEAVSTLHPDLCLLDISMPIINGIEAAQHLKKSGSSAKIVFLSVHEDDDFVRAAFAAGASGYVLKHRMATDLRVAIRETLAGRTFSSPIPGISGIRRGESGSKD